MHIYIYIYRILTQCKIVKKKKQKKIQKTGKHQQKKQTIIVYI